MGVWRDWSSGGMSLYSQILSGHGTYVKDGFTSFLLGAEIAQEEPISSSDDRTPRHAAYLFVSVRTSRTDLSGRRWGPAILAAHALP